MWRIKTILTNEAGAPMMHTFIVRSLLPVVLLPAVWTADYIKSSTEPRVAEPASLGLIGIALAVLGLFRRRGRPRRERPGVSPWPPGPGRA